jgi:hypothetical protein
MRNQERIQLLLCVLALLSALAACSNQATETPAGRPPLRVLSARGRLEEAWRLARQWREDAELIEIQADVIGPGQTRLLLVSFDFESPGEDQLTYSVICSSGGCFGQEFPIHRTWLAWGWMPIEFDDEMIDSVEAAAIGHRNGGDRFVNLRDAGMSVRLGRDKPRDVGPIVWEAYYASLSGSGPLYVVIDPYTGEVIRTE